MKHLYLLTFVLVLSIFSFAQSTILNQNFESITASGESIAGWTFLNAQTWILTGYGHNSDKYAGWDETHNADHWITTPMVNNPNTLTFWLAAYNDVSNLGVKVQVSSNGADWTDKGTFTSKGAGGDFGVTFIEKIVELQLTGSYYIRWTSVNYVDGGFYLDDITLSDIIPVELTSFTATVLNNGVSLKWSTATELNNHGFEIQRKVLDGEFATVAFVKGQGTTTQKNDYSFVDKNLDACKYSYRLKQVDLDGKYEYSKIVEVEVITITSYSLEQNYPNPFNPSTTITYSIPQNSLVSLKVYNVLGSEVTELVNGQVEAGNHKVNFNGYNLNSGVYFYTIKAGNFSETKKFTLMK